MTPLQAAELVAYLIAAKPHAKLNPGTSKVYEAELADLEHEQAMVAVQRLVRTQKWFPGIDEIRAVYVSLEHGEPRGGGDAWAEVMLAVRTHGTCREADALPVFSDPMVARCVLMWGGWNALCLSPDNDPGGRARFIELYDQLARNQRADLVAGAALPAPSKRLPAWRNGGAKRLLESVGREIPKALVAGGKRT